MELEHITAPRILKEHFRSHKGSAVMVVGRIVSVNTSSNTLTLEVNPEKNTIIQVTVNPEQVRMDEFSGLENTYLEVTGIVTDGEKTLNMKEFCRFGNTFDLNTYNELVQLSNEQFRALFR